MKLSENFSLLCPECAGVVSFFIFVAGMWVAAHCFGLGPNGSILSGIGAFFGCCGIIALVQGVKESRKLSNILATKAEEK